MKAGYTFHPGGLSRGTAAALDVNYASAGLLGFLPVFSSSSARNVQGPGNVHSSQSHVTRNHETVIPCFYLEAQDFRGPQNCSRHRERENTAQLGIRAADLAGNPPRPI